MNSDLIPKLIWIAGGIQAGIVLANFLLPRMLQVRAGVSSLPHFLKQVFYVHWVYIVIVVGFFSVLSFGCAIDTPVYYCGHHPLDGSSGGRRSSEGPVRNHRTVFSVRFSRHCPFGIG